MFLLAALLGICALQHSKYSVMTFFIHVISVLALIFHVALICCLCMFWTLICMKACLTFNAIYPWSFYAFYLIFYDTNLVRNFTWYLLCCWPLSIDWLLPLLPNVTANLINWAFPSLIINSSIVSVTSTYFFFLEVVLLQPIIVFYKNFY